RCARCSRACAARCAPHRSGYGSRSLGSACRGGSQARPGGRTRWGRHPSRRCPAPGSHGCLVRRRPSRPTCPRTGAGRHSCCWRRGTRYGSGRLSRAACSPPGAKPGTRDPSSRGQVLRRRWSLLVAFPLPSRLVRVAALGRARLVSDADRRELGPANDTAQRRWPPGVAKLVAARLRARRLNALVWQERLTALLAGTPRLRIPDPLPKKLLLPVAVARVLLSPLLLRAKVRRSSLRCLGPRLALFELRLVGAFL